MKTEELKNLEQEHLKAKSLENPLDRVRALEDFKLLTDSSSLPEFLKDRFKASAESEIQQLVTGLIEVEYLNLTDSGKLRQPVFKEVKNVEER